MLEALDKAACTKILAKSGKGRRYDLGEGGLKLSVVKSNAFPLRGPCCAIRGC
jgi:hypothetical protein